LLHDLKNVETLYRDHISRSKRVIQSVIKIAAAKFKRHSVPTADMQPHSFSEVLDIDGFNFNSQNLNSNNSKTLGPKKLLKLIAQSDI
jgi:hypothetical protein